jgi:hypothetical protein
MHEGLLGVVVSMRGVGRARMSLVVPWIGDDPDFICEVGGPDLAQRLNLPSTG